MNRNTEAEQQGPGAKPAPIPYSRPSMGAEEEQAVLQVMRSGWLTTGKQCEAFEGEFADHVAPGAGLTALATNSATAALHLGIHALNLPAGSAIALSPYTFAASINSILYNNATPRLIDCLSGGYHLDPRALEAALDGPGGKDIKAVMAVHFAGWEENADELEDICRRRGLYLIEDGAHSFPARRIDRPDWGQGTRGAFGAYSFYANKTITTGEGGMVVSSDGELIQRVKQLRLHGISRDVWDRYTQASSGYRYDITVPGYKYNMPDILAAIGRVQLGRAWDLWRQRRNVAMAYHHAFADRDWISPPPGSFTLEEENHPSANCHSWHIYSLRLVPGKLGISRDEFIQELGKRGIGTSVHFIPLHEMSYYRKRFAYSSADFPQAMAAFESTISLPLFAGLGDEEVTRVIAEVLEIGDTHYRSP